MGTIALGLAIASSLCWLMAIWVGMRGMTVRPELMFAKLRKTDIGTIYKWIDKVYYTEGENMTVHMRMPIRYLRRRVIFEFHFYRTIPKTTYFRGDCGWGERREIPVNLAGAIRLHLFPEEFEFPEESQ